MDTIEIFDKYEKLYEQRKAAVKKWNLNNKEKLKISNTKYREENKEKLKISKSNYVEKMKSTNPNWNDKVNSSSKASYQRNKEKILLKAREKYALKKANTKL